MRDGWLIQEDLALQYELLREETLAHQLADALDVVACQAMASLGAALVAMAARARKLILWLEECIVEHPTAVLVTGARAAGKSSFVHHLLGPNVVYTANAPVDHGADIIVKASGYRKLGTASYQGADGDTSVVTVAEFVEQTQTNASVLGRHGFIDDRPSWPIDRIQVTEVSDTSAACASWARHSLTTVDVVMYAVDAQVGRLSPSDVLALRQIRTCFPLAVIHIVVLKVDSLAPNCLAQVMQTLQRHHRDLFDGTLFAYSTLDGEGHEQVAVRALIARSLWQRTLDRKASQTQQYRDLVTEHIQHRRRLLAQVEDARESTIAATLLDPNNDSCAAALSNALVGFLQEYCALEMRLP